MNILMTILTAALTFGFCYVIDKYFSHAFRSKAQHQSGMAVRVNKRYGVFGVGLTVIGVLAVCVGFTGGLALLLGGAYLMWRHVITPHIPLAYLGTAAVLTLAFSRGDAPFLWMLSQLFSGGLVLGAFFMATDYATSPVTQRGRLLYGIGCGALTVLFRYVGIFPEGVTYAILLMNGLTWSIDRCTPPRRFGAQKGAKA